MKLIFNLSILFLFGSLIIYFSVTSKPGDLFFSIKLFREKLYADGTPEEEINKSTKIINDRVNSYADISKDSNCTKLVLAEEELKTQVKTYFNNLETYEKDEIGTFLSKTAESFSKLNKSEETCEKNSTIEGLQKVFMDLLYKFNTQSIDTNSLLKQSQRNYIKLKESLATNTPSNQETLDTIDELLVMFNDNLALIGKEENVSNVSILLETNNLIYQTVDSLFKGTQKVYNREGSLDVICLLKESEQICSKESLNSLWNSIYDKSSPANQITLGQEVYLEYLKLINL